MFYINYYKVLAGNGQLITKYSNIFDNCPTLGRCYKISSEEFNSLPISESNISTFYTFPCTQTLVKFAYEYLYPSFVKLLMEYGGAQSAFLDISEMKVVPEAMEEFYSHGDNWTFYNEFLNQMKLPGQETSLAKNILANGMYFPFFGSQEHFCGYGSHRLYSLQQLYKEQPFTTKFLFIQFPANQYIPSALRGEVVDRPYGNIKCKVNIPLLDIENRRIYIITTTSLNIIWELFVTFSDLIGDTISSVQDTVKPNPIFNDYDLFKEFIYGN